MSLKHWMALALTSATMSVASATIITFDEFSEGTIVNDEYAAYGVTFNGTNVDRRGRDNLAVIFDTDNEESRDPDLESPFDNVLNPELGVANPGNVLIIHENPWTCDATTDTCANPDDEGSRPAGYFTITFDYGVMLNSIDFFDIEHDEATANNAIRLFGADGNELNVGEFYTPATGGDNTWNRMNFNVADVYSMEIRLNGSGAIDNLNFTVPEPATFALLAMGIVGLGAARRRKA